MEYKHVLAIDPGKVTGMILTAAPADGTDFDILWAKDLEWDDRFTIQDIIKDVPDDTVIVVETFRLYPWAARKGAQNYSDFPSVQVIGIINVAVFNRWRTTQPPRMVMQPASARKRVMILPHHRDAVKGSQHKRDAYKHARYYIVDRYA